MRKDLPDDEICSKPAFLYCVRAWLLSSDAANPAQSDHPAPDLWGAVERVSNYSNNIQKVIRILAMVIKGWRLKSRNIAPTAEAVDNPVAADLVAAERLLLLSAMPETASALQEGRLTSLCPERDGPIIVTSGRIGEKSLSKLLGVPHLPILMHKSRAAFLYMVEAHEGEDGSVHCSLVETLARSRMKA